MKLPKNGILLETLLSRYGFAKEPRLTWPFFYYRSRNGLETEYVLDRPYRNMVRFHVDTKRCFGQAMPGIKELMALSPAANGLGAWDYSSRKQLDEILGLFCRLLEEEIIPRLEAIESESYQRYPDAQANRYLYENYQILGHRFCEMEPAFADSSAERAVEILVDHFLFHCRKGEPVDQECLYRVSAAFMNLTERLYDAKVEWNERFGSCMCIYDKGANHKELIPARVGAYLWYLLNEKEDSEEAKEWMLGALSHDVV